MTFLNECIFGEDCDLCKYFDYDGSCYCWLVLAFLAVILLILIIIIFLIANKIKTNKFEEEVETANYVRTYKELEKKRAEDLRKKELLEAKENGEDGSEDILVQLVKEISDEERLNLGEVKFEKAAPREKAAETVAINFQKKKEEDNPEENN